MADKTIPVPQLWWEPGLEEFFAHIDGAYYTARVEAYDNPIGAGLPANAVELGDVAALRAKLAKVREIATERGRPRHCDCTNCRILAVLDA